jgi:hypothetical protein
MLITATAVEDEGKHGWNYPYLGSRYCFRAFSVAAGREVVEEVKKFWVHDLHVCRSILRSPHNRARLVETSRLLGSDTFSFNCCLFKMAPARNRGLGSSDVVRSPKSCEPITPGDA